MEIQNLKNLPIISFNQIKEKFDPNLYNIGYLTHNDLIKLMNFPIKLAPTCTQETKINISYNLTCCGIIVIKHTLDYDYSIDEDIPKFLSQIPYLSFIAPIGNLPMKVAQVLSGTGQYGKNQVVYDYKFGFETHIGMAIINNELIDLPKRNLPNWDYLPQCKDCNDCYNACPVHALHNNDTPPWVDWVKCSDFNNYGNHPIIPSMKWGWGKHIANPPISDEILQKINTKFDLQNLVHIDSLPYKINQNGIIKSIQYPICRECTSQPKCSKFNGQFPYDKDRVKIY